MTDKSLAIKHSSPSTTFFKVLILSFGTCFEFYDFMLYTLLFKVFYPAFFPIFSKLSNNILEYSTFCITYLLTPVGAFCVGLVGDKLGRKKAIWVTTTLMSISCLIITFLPDYSKIGLFAPMIMILCRITQSMTSIGEIVGVWVYLTENLPKSLTYVSVAITNACAIMGHFFALIVAFCIINFNINWRYAFVIGIFIAVTSMLIRSFLIEEEYFTQQQNNNADSIQDNTCQVDLDCLSKIKLLASSFVVHLASPTRFCFVYFYLSKILKQNFMYTDMQVMKNNFLVVLTHAACEVLFGFLCRYYHFLKLVKFKAYGFLLLVIFSGLVADKLDAPIYILLLQCAIMSVPFDAGPGYPAFLKCFSIFNRYRYFALTFSAARVFGFVVIPFCILSVDKMLGFQFTAFIFVPFIVIIFLLGVSYFASLIVD